jgi:uncharacterized protein
MSTKEKTLVFGATPNPDRYSYKAVKMLADYGHEPVPVGIRKGNIVGLEILPGTPSVDNIDTLTLYVNPEIQRTHYDYFLSLRPKRVIFNPGTENPEFESICTANGIEPLEACTLVLLSTGQY